MSTDTIKAPVIEKEALLSPKVKKAFKDPLLDQNPVTIQILGICSSLAVTTQVKPALIMAIGLTLVTAFSNVVISMMRNAIPNKIRIIIELAVVATMVILVDQLLQAFAFDLSRKLSVFVGLIITNCIVMGRLEAFALGNKPWPSFVDGIGNGLGYAWVLILISTIREIFASGTWFGFNVIPQSFYAAGYVNNGLLLFPPGAFVILGLIIWAQRARSGHAE